jgi:C4-type Zn-finger protein
MTLCPCRQLREVTAYMGSIPPSYPAQNRINRFWCCICRAHQRLPNIVEAVPHVEEVIFIEAVCVCMQGGVEVRMN